jgi:hypothetical protein
MPLKATNTALARRGRFVRLSDGYPNAACLTKPRQMHLRSKTRPALENPLLPQIIPLFRLLRRCSLNLLDSRANCPQYPGSSGPFCNDPLFSPLLAADPARLPFATPLAWLLGLPSFPLASAEGTPTVSSIKGDPSVRVTMLASPNP